MSLGKNPPPEIHETVLELDVMVPARDGTLLATDLHRPAQTGRPLPGPFPALLQRTPYGKSAESRISEARFFAQRGYVVVIQDCRGRYSSQGGFTKYVEEGPDGYDTVEWLAQQSWSNGKIGTYGLSYAAHTQAALACLNPPHLACMWLDCGGFSNAYLSGCRNGGAFELRQLTWAFREALESPAVQGDPLVKKPAMESQSVADWFERLPWRKGHSPLQWAPDYENYLLQIWGREKFDDYWCQIGLCAEAHYGDFSGVPQVHLGGWYDTYSRSTTDNYVALSGSKKGPIRLIMGPWTHGARSVTYAGDVDLGPAAAVDGNLAVDYNHLRLQFFDRWLQGRAAPETADRPVSIFVMGGGGGGKSADGRLIHGGRWRKEPEWPLSRTQDTAFYLQPGGRLSTEFPSESPQVTRFLFDPDRPVPTIGGNISSGQPIMEPGGFDQQESPRFHGSRSPYLPLATRADVALFQTEPLEAEMEVTGTVVVKLWITSSAVDTDFTAKLLDVYPPNPDYPRGYALNLTDGIIRAKFRDSWMNPELMEPGEAYSLTLQLPPTSNLFVKGHRIRLDLSSSNFPRFDVNPNTGENPACARGNLQAWNTIFHEAVHPSQILLPLVPSEE